MKNLIMTCLIAVFLVSAASAQVLYVPASAHVSGSGGTEWRTDLEVKAKGGESATFKVELLKERVDNSQAFQATFNVDAGQSMRLVDVVNDVFSFDGAAALRITTTNGMIMVTSRTYNNDPDGTFGQFIPAFEAESAAESGFDYALIQLSNSESYRTNIGFLNTSDLHHTVEVDLYTASGLFLGSTEFALRSYELWQANNIFAIVSDDDVEAGYAIVRTRTADARFMTYASVVDNNSGDPVFVPAQLEGPTAEEAEPRFVVFEGFMRDG